MPVKTQRVPISQMFESADRVRSRAALDLPPEAVRTAMGVRTELAGSGRHGTHEVLCQRDVIMMFAAIALGEPIDGEILADEPALMVRIDLGGAEGRGADLRLKRPGVTVTYLAKGTRQKYSVQTRQRMVAIVCRPPALAKYFGLQKEQLPAAIEEALNRPGRSSTPVQLPVDGSLSEAASRLFSCTLTGEERRLYLEGTLRQLMALVMAKAKATHEEGTQGTAGDHSAARRARDILAARFVDPPDIDEMVQRVGVGRTKLRAEFMNTFGVTMKEFCLELRMQEAQRLLSQGDLSVATISRKLGYRDPSNFTHCFRARFGKPPSALTA